MINSWDDERNGLERLIYNDSRTPYAGFPSFHLGKVDASPSLEGK